MLRDRVKLLNAAAAQQAQAGAEGAQAQNAGDDVVDGVEFTEK